MQSKNSKFWVLVDPSPRPWRKNGLIL